MTHGKPEQSKMCYLGIIEVCPDCGKRGYLNADLVGKSSRLYLYVSHQKRLSKPRRMEHSICYLGKFDEE